MPNFGRGSSRFRGRDSDRHSGPRGMFSATCSNCGKECRVPFRPTGSKPVYCSDCFEKMGNSSESRSFGGRDNRRSRFGARNERRGNRNGGHEATCDDCGRRCTVPFRPEPGKAVYCDSCFAKHSGNGADKSKSGGSQQVNLEKQIADLTAKVDAILEILNTAVVGMDEDFDDEAMDEDALVVVDEPVVEKNVVTKEKKKAEKKTTKVKDEDAKAKKSAKKSTKA